VKAGAIDLLLLCLQGSGIAVFGARQVLKMAMKL
jgi:hypothetical protein